MQLGARIGLVSDSALHLFAMQALVRDSGHQVVNASAPGRLNAAQLQRAGADAWVVSLCESAGGDELLSLLWEAAVPVLIDEALGSSAADPVFERWCRGLGSKLRATLGRGAGLASPPADNPLLAAAQRASQRGQVASDVWVLGASLGGPEAVRAFLAGIPAGFPVSFVYAQHIDATCVALLSRVMARNCALSVIELGQDSVLCRAQLGVVPVERELEFLPLGRVRVGSGSWPGRYAPTIDAVVAGIAGLFGERAGAIIFSGMGDDGAEGCAAMRRRGGAVWTQSCDSCVCAAMPEAVLGRGGANYSDTPAGLARALVERYR